VETRQDPSIARCVEKRQREALVAAGLLERVVADEPDALEGTSLCTFEDGHPRRQFVQLARDRKDLVEVRIEDSLEAVTLRATSQTEQAPVDPARLSRQQDDCQQEDEDEDAEHDDEGVERGLRERVDVDPRVLLWGRPSLAGASDRDRTGGGAILCRRQPEPPQHGGVARMPTAIHPMEAFQETMAKRARGTTSRPGQRPPLQRQAARPATRPLTTSAPIPRPETLTDAEEARAAQLEAAIVAEERQAEAAKNRSRAARTVDAAPVRATSSLSVSTAEEYAYVARDVKRVAIVGGSLVIILLAIWVIAHVTGLISI
jgi:hypothetical protein